MRIFYREQGGPVGENVQGSKTLRSWRHFAIIGLCLALLYVFGVSSLKSHPATLDDWDSIKHLSTSQNGPINSIAETIESVIDKTRQDHAPGYFVLLNLWSRFTGLDLFTLRLLSVFIGLFALVCTYRLALSTGKPETAMDATILATFIAFVVYYTYTVRLYSLLPTLSIAVLWSYWRVLSTERQVSRRLWLAFIVSSAAILWVHYFGTILLGAVGVYHLFFASKNRRWLQICLAATVAGLLFAPWLPVFIEGLAGRAVPASDALSFFESASALASIYTNGLPLLVPVIGVVAAANFRLLNRSQQYILIVVSTIFLLMLIGNEFAPLLIARRIRYTLILALPWACALAIGLNRVPHWRFLRIPFLILWIAAFAAYSRSDQLLLYTNWLTLNLHKTPPYQDLLYESKIDPEPGDYILSFHPDASVYPAVFQYYDQFLGRWSGLNHIWVNSDGQPAVQSSDQNYGTIESMAFWKFRVWLVYNPEQTDLESMSSFTAGFQKYYKSCGRYLEKSKSVIELFGPKDIPCKMLTAAASSSLHIHYDNGSVLRFISVELHSDKLTVYLWWPQTMYGDYAYSLQIFNQDGTKVDAQTDTVITDIGFYVEDIDVSSLSAGEYDVKLIVYDRQSLEGQPGIIFGPQHRFQRDVEVGRFQIGG
ncbi:MAG: glycosyltransferase family 39 protein [Anaerolineae bacterium]|nr:glycosyltransferase family 39 protein [Anaerolineae bacterium]